METIKSILERISVEVNNRYELNKAAEGINNGTMTGEELMQLMDKLGKRTEEARLRERNKLKESYKKGYAPNESYFYKQPKGGRF